ncbi:MAG: Hpt domain-containing protein [Actinomycetota bacterium]|nr:Hpt domain-containing protein [Actinomycetota bacterium]
MEHRGHTPLTGGADASLPGRPGPVDEAILDELFMVLDDGAPEELLGICNLFISGVPARLGDIDAALDEGRLVDAARAAHSLKGTGGAFGARRVGEVAGRLEQVCHASDGLSAAALAKELHVEFFIFREILATRIAELSARS